MKSLKKGIISLLAFVMALTLTPSVFAATDEDASGSGTAASYKVTNPGASSEDGLYSNKTLSLNDDGTGTITLETYVTGSIQQTGTPTDIVLVLDVSQSMSQSMGSTTRLAALKAAVSTFIDTTAKKNEAAKTEDLKSRISIVSFSGSATVVSDFSTDATTLKSKVNSLTTSRGTAADYGMQKAQSQVSSIPASRESNKVVIFFTDGEPNHGSGSFDTSVANDAISAAKTIKAAGATVYSIGVVSGADPSLDPTQSSTSNINKFLHGISSNYPDATTYTNLGTRAKDSKGNDLTCYKSATNASELEKIFDDIGEEAVPSVKLDASSVVQDAMSEYVVSDVSDDNPIQLYTSKYTGNDTFADPVAAPDAVTADVSDGIVKVTGFDFEPVIDKEDGTCQGQKLIVEIPVKLTDEAKSMSGETLNSNDEDSSAIYVEGEQTPVRKFGTPTVGIPKTKITVTANSAEKVYDGKALTDNGYTIEGTLAKGDVLTAVVEGTQTNAGSSPNEVKSYKVMRGDKDVTDMYDITPKNGTLTVTPIGDKVTVTITGKSGSYDYDGTKKTVTGYTASSSNVLYNVDGDKKDYEFNGSDSVSGTNVDTYDMGLRAEDFKNTNNNFTNVEFVIEKDGQLTITPKEVAFEGETANKIYNGEEQTITGITADGLVQGHEYSGLTYAAKGTNVGDYNGKFSGTLVITDKEGNDVTKNYKVTKTPGTLTITPFTDEVVVTIKENSGTYEYDGTEKKVTGYTVSINNAKYTEDDFTFSGDATVTRTDAGTSNMELKESDFKNKNDNFENVKFVIEDGQLKITKKEVTFTGETASKVYNRQEQEINGITQSGLVDGHELTGLKYAAKGTEVGEYDGEFTGEEVIKDAKGNDVTKNYKVTKKPGKLTITSVTDEVIVTIRGNSATYEYDGTEKKATGYSVVSINNTNYTKDDFTFSGDATVTRTDAGTSNMELKESDFKNKNDNFENVKFVIEDGQLKITKKAVTFKGETASKVYNRKEQKITKITDTGLIDGHKYSGLEYVAKGTDVGEYDGEFSGDVLITDAEGNDVTKNYKVTKNQGKLTITPVEEEIVVTITEHSGKETYDGTEKKVTGYDASSSNDLYIVEGDSKDFEFTGDATVTGTDVDTYNMELKESDFDNKNENFSKVKFVIVDGQLEITKKAVTFTGETASKVYTGEEQEINGITVDGLIEGHEYSELTYSAKRKTVGTTDGTFSGEATIKDAKGNDVTKNYDVTKTPGKLTITEYTDEIIVTIKENSGTYEYDGTEKKVTGYTVSINNDKYTEDDFTFSGDATVTRTDAGTSNMELKESDFKNKNENFNKVTFVIVDGQLEITKKAVTFKGETASKVYNREEQEITGITDAGLVDGHKYSGLEYVAKGTNVGDYNGKFSGSLVITDKEGNNVTENYDVTKTPGTLTITPITEEVVVTIRENSATYEYDGTEKKATGYSVVSIDNPNYTKDDFTFSGDATVTRTDAGTSNMELKPEDFDNKNDNFKKVKFVIEDGQLVITEKAVTFKGETASKVYNREEQKITKITDAGLVDGHKYSGLEYVAKGTNVGDYNGKFSGSLVITDKEGNDVTKNYKVTKTPGTLTITPITDEVVVTIQGNRGTYEYDGTEKKVTGYDASSSNDLYIVEGDSKDFEFTGDATVTGTDVDTYDMKLKESDFDNTNKNFTNVKFVIEDGQLKITKKAVTFEGETTTREYNREEQKITGITQNGLVDGHEYSELTYSAKGTNVGEYDGEFSGEVVIKDAKGNDVTKNYKVTTKPGKLTITPVQREIVVTITEHSGTETYDGTEKKVTGYDASSNDDIYYVEGDKKDFEFSGDATVTGTDVGNYDMELKKSDFENTNKNFTNVKFVIKDGQLIITPAKITNYVELTPKNTEKVYDGTPLAAGEATAKDSLGKNRLKIEYSVDGKTWTEDYKEITATNVADSKTVKVRVSDDDKGNYEGYVEGTETITITPATLKVVTPSAKKTYDGEPLTKKGTISGLIEGETLTFKTTGTQTKVGKSDNTYEIVWDGTAVESNYTIVAEIGELEVTKAKDTPDTGDDSNVVLYGFMGLTALAAELFMVSRRRRNGAK